MEEGAKKRRLECKALEDWIRGISSRFSYSTLMTMNSNLYFLYLMMF